jgi:hypothetical protein
MPGRHNQTVGWLTGSGWAAADEADGLEPELDEPPDEQAARSAVRANRTTITAARGRGTTHILHAGKEYGMTTGQIIAGIVIFGSVMLLMLGIMLWGVFTENRNR